MWAAASRDYGESWSQPQLIGSECRQVNDLAASLAGWLVTGLVCNDGPERVQPAIATRTPDGVWSLDRLPGAIWYFSDGAVALRETATGPQVTVTFLTGPNGAVTPPPRVLVFSRNLVTDTTWSSQSRNIVIPGVETGGRTWHARALVYRPEGASSDSMTFLFSDAERWQVYALTSQDAGQSWLPAELVVAPARGDERIAFAAPAYDPIGQRVAAIWICCAEGSLLVRDASTHYLRWSALGSGVWADVTPNQRVPLITGARASGELVTAQARNARTVWITWIEGGNTVEVRSFDLTTVLPQP